ncbi:MAG: glycosyltransferase family A protein [Candidatus Algichlamydia australiensis]|nr:glycosyltransferase family A protein [Chlamydiales bacterium]
MIRCFFVFLSGFVLTFFALPNLLKQQYQIAQPTAPKEEKPFVVLMSCYNNAAYVRKTLQSVAEQVYGNFRLIYIDDASTDDNFSVAKEVVAAYGLEEKATMIRNKKNVGAMANHVNAVGMCKDREIIVLLDGDDSFSNPYVLEKLNQVYANPHVWLTYGSHIEVPTHNLGKLAQPVPKKVLEEGTIRKCKWTTSHLRTYYAGLAKKIRLEDQKDRGKYLPSTSDLATMLPMIDMARLHAYYIPDCLVLYQSDNPLSDCFVRGNTQFSLAEKIRNIPPYEELQVLFNPNREE